MKEFNKELFKIIVVSFLLVIITMLVVIILKVDKLPKDNQGISETVPKTISYFVGTIKTINPSNENSFELLTKLDNREDVVEVHITDETEIIKSNKQVDFKTLSKDQKVKVTYRLLRETYPVQVDAIQIILE